MRPHHGTITLGDDTTYNIKGIGESSLRFGISSCRLTNVLYMLGLTKKLLSVNQFLDHNLKIEFDTNQDKKIGLIKDKSKNDKIVTSATEIGKMFRLDTIHNNHALVTIDNNISMLWHHRSSHSSTSYLFTLCKKGMVKELPQL